MLELKPIDQKAAFDFINKHHSHHRAPRGDLFRVSVWDGEKTVGVIVVGRPVARKLQDGWTAEVTRCCTDGTKNAASMLYGAACRMARAAGYRRLISYTLKAESGISLIAGGWKKLYDTPGKSWNVPSRRREDKHPIGQKALWEATL